MCSGPDSASDFVGGVCGAVCGSNVGIDSHDSIVIRPHDGAVWVCKGEDGCGDEYAGEDDGVGGDAGGIFLSKVEEIRLFGYSPTRVA
eukprot:m.27368 g.27368  ORF g.27368 m.27368 type:complete len:88 (-) comp13414_c0_seq2:755-1018(-)